MPPPQVDQDKTRRDSDLNIVILAYHINNNRKQSVVTQPLSDAGMEKCTQYICSEILDEALSEPNVDDKISSEDQIKTG